MRVERIYTRARANEVEEQWTTQKIPSFLGGVYVNFIGTCAEGFGRNGDALGLIQADYKFNYIQLGFKHNNRIQFLTARDDDPRGITPDRYDNELIVRYQVQEHGFIELIIFET